MNWNPIPLGQVQLAPNNQGFLAPQGVGAPRTAYTALPIPGYEDTQRFANRAASNPLTVRPGAVMPPAAARPSTAPQTWGREARLSAPVQQAFSGVQNPMGPFETAMPNGLGADFSQFAAPYQSLSFGAPTEMGPYNTGAVTGGLGGEFAEYLDGNSFMDKLIGNTDKPGWGGFALGALNAGSNIFFGLKQYDLAKQTLNENKRQFQLNYDAQKQTTNTALEDRQRARVAGNPGAYQSVDDYMKNNGVK